MSKVKIEGNASGTGTLTISAPNTDTDRTLTLPDGAGEILTDASTLSSSNLSGALPAIDGSALTGLSAGAVHQVVRRKTTNGTTLSSHTQADVYDAYVTITPTSSSNNILILSLCQLEGGNGDTVGFGITNSTQSTDVSGFGTYQETFTGFQRRGSVQYGYDSPASTSAQTYKLQYQAYSGNSGDPYAGGNGRNIVMIAIEVSP